MRIQEEIMQRYVYRGPNNIYFIETHKTNNIIGNEPKRSERQKIPYASFNFLTIWPIYNILSIHYAHIYIYVVLPNINIYLLYIYEGITNCIIIIFKNIMIWSRESLANKSTDIVWTALKQIKKAASQVDYTYFFFNGS